MRMAASSPALPPRVCYVGSVPVENTSAGPAQLYRLLEDFPPDGLRIVELGGVQPRLDRRLRDVEYFSVSGGIRRGLRFASRFAPAFYWRMVQANADGFAKRIIRRLGRFQPEAVLTVHDRYGWMAAERVASRLKVPFHIILHDDWYRNMPAAAGLKQRFDAWFGHVYAAAGGRLCVSEGMESWCASQFGVRGQVLYPMWNPTQVGPSDAAAQSPVSRFPGLTVAYVGGLSSDGYWKLLIGLADALDRIGGRLLLVGSMTREEAAAHGLTQRCVEFSGFVFAEKLKAYLLAQADVLYVPMSFEPGDRPNMEVSFPSKLCEYASVGLPLLIQGPAYCSAIQWSLKYAGVAESLNSTDRQPLDSTLARLLAPDHRSRLGAEVLRVGNDLFSPPAVRRVFRNALESARLPA